MFEKYLADRQVCRAFEKHFVPVHVDVAKDPGGKGLYEKYGPPRGVPAWSVLDAGRKVLADSMRGGENVGFPYEPAEVDHFLGAVRKACPGLPAEDFAVLRDRLAEHGKARRAELEARRKAPGGP